jgi:protein TonB
MTDFAMPRRVWKILPTGWAISLILHAIVLLALIWFVGTSTSSPISRLTTVDPCQVQAAWRMPLPSLVLHEKEIALQPPPELATSINEEIAQVETPVEIRPSAKIPTHSEKGHSQVEQMFVYSRLESGLATEFYQGPQSKNPEDSSTEKLTTSSASLAAQMPSPVTGPTLLERIPPEYPRSARRAGIEGDVRLNLNIDGQGNVVSVAVCGGSGSTLLDDTAVTATRQWRFAPSGTATAATVVVTISFRLQQ